MSDLITGIASGYTWQDLEPFVVSLRRSGYTGRCILILGDGPKEKVDFVDHSVQFDLRRKLEGHGIEVHEAGQFEEHPILARFPLMAMLIEKCAPRFVLCVDTKDIVFQSNPSTWLEENLPADRYDLAVASEGTLYRESEGNKRNILAAYGEHAFNMMAEEEVMNAGVIGGRPEQVKALLLAIHELSLKDKRLATFNPTYKDMIADQTAMNMLLRVLPHMNKVFLASPLAGFVSEYQHLHCGPTPDGRLELPHDLAEAVRTGLRRDWPHMDYSVYRNGMMYPGGSEKPFALLHQYFNNRELWRAVRERYREQ